MAGEPGAADGGRGTPGAAGSEAPAGRPGAPPAGRPGAPPAGRPGAPPAGRPHLGAELAGATLVVTLDRPQARNALTAAMRADLVAMLDEAAAARSVAAVVLTGTDPAFSAGLDLHELVGTRRPADAVDAGLVERLRTMPVPVVAAVNGACVTGALELVLSCSFVIASERARFADTHARVGLVPGWGMSALLPRAVGVRRARQMSFGGEFLDAAEARAAGLVNEVVPHGSLLARALEIGDAMATCEPAALAAAVGMYADGADETLDAALAREAATFAAWEVDPTAALERFGRR